jgi:hypothetical protein
MPAHRADPSARERELIAELAQSRERLTRVTGSLGTLIEQGLSPAAAVRRKPLSSVAAAVAAGLLVGWIAAPNGRRRETDGEHPHGSAALSILSQVSRIIAPTVVPLVAAWFAKREIESDET